MTEEGHGIPPRNDINGQKFLWELCLSMIFNHKTNYFHVRRIFWIIFLRHMRVSEFFHQYANHTISCFRWKNRREDLAVKSFNAAAIGCFLPMLCATFFDISNRFALFHLIGDWFRSCVIMKYRNEGLTEQSLYWRWRTKHWVQIRPRVECLLSTDSEVQCYFAFTNYLIT